jgi:hypothetical protein
MRGACGGAAALVLAALSAAPGCSDGCCTFDSQPIALARAEQGELLALVGADGAEPQPALLDTGSPISIWNEPIAGTDPVVRRRNLAIFGAGGSAPLRAVLRGMSMVGGPLAAIAGAGAPAGLLGGDLLSAFSVEIGFAAPELVLWSQQPAPDGFLSAAGYAVLRIRRSGAGELAARAPSSGIGPAGPFQYPPALLVARACAAPAAFDREALLPVCCVGDERQRATGTDLSLLVGTGFGPVILGRRAWQRVTAAMPIPTALGPPLLLATAGEVPAEWAMLPRLALVDREADTSVDPGPCVELGRARRLEQVALAQSRNSERAVCALPCDQDFSNTDHPAQNSAGYIELGGELPVAIVDDGAAILQTLRGQVRPEGPEVDGIVGAGTLRSARVEIDYRSQPARAIFSCEVTAASGTCRAVGRCPRLPEQGQTHTCFGLPPHALPRMCDNPANACQ